MTKGINGISPILALILTLIVGYLTVRLFLGGHVFWGIVFALITIDFCAVLSKSTYSPLRGLMVKLLSPAIAEILSA